MMWVLLILAITAVFGLWFPPAVKWIGVVKSNTITIWIQSLLIFRARMMNKKKNIGFILGITVGVVLGFIFAWLLFHGDGDRGWNIIRDSIVSVTEWIKRIIVLVSPYGRVPKATEKLAYAMHWSTGWSLLELLLCLIGSFAEKRKYFVPKVLISFSSFFFMWYSLFGFCNLVVAIPVWYRFLSALIISLISSFEGLLLFLGVMEVSNKLDS